MNQVIRVRYAPSPTGYPHIGNIRTALFNWLFARHYEGRFIVRIEDTDQSRLVPGATEAILEALRWLGLDWDEGPEVGGDYGPYFQSQRLEFYRGVAKRLVEQGDAYYCFCSPQRLEQMRAAQLASGRPPGYDRRCLELTSSQKEAYLREGIKPVIRMKVPLEGETAFYDEIRGKIIFNNSTLDDFILLKSDGYPTYHLASVVDDNLMAISHVLRAEEWLSSTPKHILIYKALNITPPQFAHLPIILGPDRAKLSKRHGAVSVLEYREQGYLPEALINFLALLGWSLDDKSELFTVEELVKYFQLERVSKTPAVFNADKLTWMNGVYLRRLDTDDLAQRAIPFLERSLPPEVKQPLDIAYVRAVIPLVQERAKTLAEIPMLVDFFFLERLDYDPHMLTGNMDRSQAIKALAESLEELHHMEVFTASALEQLLRPLASKLGLKTGQFFGILRVALTGRTAAPPLFDTMTILGKERCIKRLHDALTRINALPADPGDNKKDP